MDKNNLVLAVIVAATIIIITVLLKKSCVVQVYPSCPNIPSSQYTNTPTGKCLLDCDQYSDDCYQKCDPKDEDCIGQCYQLKAHCYMSCLGPQQDTCSNNCNCG